MAALDTALPTRPSGVFSTVSNIAVLALPLMVGAVAAAGLHMAKTSILTHNDATDALFTLSFIQPAFILMLAFLEALAITNQVFASRTVARDSRGDIRKATRIYTVMGLILVVLLSGAFYGSSFFVERAWADGPRMLPIMALFVASMAPYMLFELRNGAMRGLGFTAQALMPFAVLIVVDLAVTWVGITQFDMGFNAIMLGNAVGPLVALPLVMWQLHRKTRGEPLSESSVFRRSVIGLTIGVAGPVFVSMFASAATAAVIFPALAALGENVSSAFLIIVRLRILFIIPAIAIGSAIAIMVNHLPDKGAAMEKRSILRVGVTSVTLFYLAATLVIFGLRYVLIDVLVPQEQLQLFQTTLNLMVLLIATFALLASSTMLQVILEHLGYGVRVLVIVIVTELLTIGFALWSLRKGYQLDGLVWTMNGMAVVTCILLGLVYLKLVAKLEKSDVV